MASTKTETAPPQSIVIYCDGACSGNPGPGGWGSIVGLPGGEVFELGGGAKGTTNNQMELTATIEALKAIENIPGEVLLHTDSVYVIRGITQWIWGWMKRGWKTAEGADVLNKDLWQALGNIVSKRKKSDAIQWKYVRGHTGIAGNERCDQIAVAFSKNIPVSLYRGPASSYRFSIYTLPIDEGLPEMSGKKNGAKAAAFSYVSLLGATPMRHKTWAECERRVKGQPGARFKKATSADDEAAILRSWGVDPKSIKQG